MAKLIFEHDSFKKVLCFLQLFCLLFIVFFPIDIIPWQRTITNASFGKIIEFISKYSIACKSLAIDSDSNAMYIFVVILLMLALIFVMLTPNNIYNAIHKFAQISLNYYIILILWQYGWDKITLQQFYKPESNILYTTIGNVHLDTLYWSTIGLSPAYCIFLGIVEIIAGILLLVKCTRFLGLVFAVGIFINVVAVNFCFDINVKLFSSFLLLISLLQIAPYIWQIYNCVRHQLPLQPFYNNHTFHFLSKKIIRFLIVISMLCLITHPYLQQLKFSKIASVFPQIYGAYKVVQSKNQTNAYLFIHKNNYLITQNYSLDMIDCKIEVNDTSIAIIKANKIEDRYYCQKNAAKALAFVVIKKDTLYLQKINIDSLPILQKEFHWSTDDYE